MPYNPVFAQNFLATTPFGSDLSNLYASGNAFVAGTMNVISKGFYMNTLTVNSNLVVTTNSYIGTTLNVVQYINTAFLNTAGITTTGNIANTFGNVSITGNIITTNIFCTNLISQSNISNTFGNVAITGNLVTSQNIYCFNMVTQSNIANTYGNVAVSGNLITTNIFCTNLISQSNISNTFGNVAITGNLVTSQNIYCFNMITQSNISNTYGNVAVSGNLVTTNVFCTNLISRSNISNTFGNVAITGNLVTSQNLYSENMILRTNLISTSATVKISGNAIVERDLQVSSNLTVNGFITDFFQLIGSSYFFLYNQFTLPAPQTKNNGIQFFGISLNDFNNASQVIPTQSSKYLYAITTNGNFRFNQLGLFKVTCVFATDQALGRIGVGSSTSDIANNNRPTTMAYEYMYQYDVTQVPTVPVTLPILVTDTSKIYYIDIMAYRTLPTVIYETAKLAGDYTTAVGGTYIAIGPF
jgi:hypothetical protein